MSATYFHRVAKETATRLWINNPTGEEMDLGIAAGAINVTLNPSYASRLIQNEPEYIRRVIDAVMAETEDDEETLDRVNQTIAKRTLDKFRPLYEQSSRKQGYVTFQADPRVDHEMETTVNDILRYRKSGENLMAKIPVIPGGLQAIEILIGENVPICATECFAVSQAIQSCELYERAAKKSGKQPPFYVTHITGIFDEYLQNYVRSKGVRIDPHVLEQAGCIVARKEYRLLKEKGYNATMLGGGARGTQHFTEMVGGNIHVTLNWNTIKELIDADGPVISRIDVEAPKAVLDELSRKLPHFRKAFIEDALSLEEFADFGGVVYFRNMFLKGYESLLKEIRERRARLEAAKRCPR